MPGSLYADDLVLCDESEEDLRAIVGRFIEVCRRRDLKVNAGRSKVMLLSGEEGLECEVCVNGYVDEAECSRKVASGRRCGRCY